jgi:regulator of nucleoside diphosphate kinase
MFEQRIEITETDAVRLRELLARLAADRWYDRDAIELLRRELDRAVVASPDQVGEHVVTMQSHVELEDEETRETEIYSLVYPEDADFQSRRLSVMAPIGMAILGYREGDVIEWRVPAGTRRIRIKKVLYQPEAAGHEPLNRCISRSMHPAPWGAGRP